MREQRDLAYMEMAYGLAERGRGRTSPNPAVGAVLVSGDTIVGYGFHARAGLPHAEITALERAGGRSRGADLYLTLEPCVHQGRTPPCIDALLRSGIRRAVISDLDPNPKVDGRGERRLREAGIEVTTGLLKEKNRALNEAYIKYIKGGLPFLTAKIALSLDGKTAARTGDSTWITSRETRRWVHLLRSENDAVMVGADTVIRDDPQLTVRHPLRPDKKLTRVVLDSRLRFPTESRLLQTLDRGDVLIFTSPEPDRERVRALEDRGARVLETEADGERVDPSAVLRRLAEMETTSVLSEGGSRLLTSLVERKLVDKIVLTFSPRLIGGRDAPGVLGGQGPASPDGALPLKKIRRFQIGGDIIVEGYL